MLQQSSDPDSVAAYVEAVRRALYDDRLRGKATDAARWIPGAADPVTRVRQVLPDPDRVRSDGPEPDGSPVPYLARDPAVSLVQSAVEERFSGALPDSAGPLRRLWHRLLRVVEGLLHPGRFTPDDPDWVVKIAESMLGHLARGNHSFNPLPAERAISDSARLVLVGDWGTGLPRARALAVYMAEEVTAAIAAGRQAHVVHLGDVYYSGLPTEYERHVLAYWPVSAAQAAAGVTSWSCNGNHDMYSGGFGYFQTLLADPRFAAQRSADGRATSYFRLTSPSWEFIGLDTAWDTDVLSKGRAGVLREPQAEYVASVATASDRRLALLSHHQYVSAYDQGDIGPELSTKLAAVLDSRRVRTWWWGHEHRCMGFRPHGGVEFPRCLGHGGVPVLQPRTPDEPVAAPGAWEQRDVVIVDGQRWARFGFAVLDLDGERISVRYRNDQGAVVRTEEIT